MSIYATYWQIKLPVWVPCGEDEKEAEEWSPGQDFSQPGRPVRERWVKVYAQAVPAHIGHPSAYSEGDPYADFLPPVVEYDPNDWHTAFTPRAVFILDEDHDEKVDQRYTAPLLVLTGAEYEAAPFSELLRRIQEALEQRFGSSEPVIGRRCRL